MTQRHREREIATFSRLRENRNSICRRRSSPDDVAIEISTTAPSLARKFVDGSDPSALGQPRPEKIDLHVVGAGDKNVVDPNREGPPLSVGPALSQ